LFAPISKIKGEKQAKLIQTKLIDLENSINARCRPEKSLIMFQRFKESDFERYPNFFRDQKPIKAKI